MRHTASLVPIALVTILAAPARATTADDLCGPTDDPCVVSGTRQVDDGSAINVGARELQVRGRLDVGPGMMSIVAGKLTVDGELRATGNDTTAGGTIRALAGSIAIDGTVDVSGSSGGSVQMGTAGRFSVGGAINADHRAGDEGGGTIELDGGAIEVTGSLTARGGDDDSGGDVDVSARGALVFRGTADVSGGDGGDIDLSATTDLTVASSATLRTDGTLVGCDGGDIDLLAGSPTNPDATLVMEGRMLSTGHAGNEDDGGGSGGTFTLGSTGDVVLMRSAALLSATGGKPDGFGGDVDVTAGGSVNLHAFVNVLSNGNDGSGGTLEIDAGGDGGGDVDVTSRGESLNVASGIEIDTRATGGGGGGTIQLASAGALSVAGTLRTDGSNDVPGSLIELDACAVRVEASGILSSLKRQGKNVLIGHDATVVAGRLRADASTGANELHFAGPEQQPVVLAGASIDPVALEIVDASVHPCAGTPPTFTVTPSSTPTATRPLAATATPTSTAVSTPTPTPTQAGTATRPPPAPCVGDCNADGTVSVDELVLATDIALGRAPLAQCTALDRTSDGLVTVDEPIAAVRASLGGCLP